MFMKKKNHNRKWQQRPQLYRGRYYYVRRLMQVCLVSLVIGAVVAFSFYLKNSDALLIKNVVIMGDLNHLTEHDVLVLSELKNGDKLYTKNLNDIQKNIERFSWVKSVSVRRKFPDTLQIHITERTPIAFLLMDKFYIIDDTNMIFKPREADDPNDLPVITGFEKKSVETYPVLNRTFFDFTLNMLSFLNKQDFYKANPVSELHFDEVYGFTVYTLNDSLEIYYGSSDFPEKQQTLEKFKLSKHFENLSLVRLDLDKAGRIVARLAAASIKPDSQPTDKTQVHSN